ncbi:MAG: class II aldolase/adducin family protein, partial [Microcoleaceae cyanobacterium]
MKSRWDQSYADSLNGDLLLERVYTSRLLGQETDLVLHGGGNTSVKANIKNFFGDLEEVLYIKGSGWDLSTIESAGFAPVRLSVLQRLAELTSLSDSEMVREQRATMLDPYAPNPSVEAILHAIIPYRFVDHTHADAVVTLTNNPTGFARVKEVYGEQVLIIPYVMPGFILAQEIRNLTKDVDWHKYQGMILMNHGIFSFADDAKTAYERMIDLVTLAEEYLTKQNAMQFAEATGQTDLLTLSKIRKAVSQVKGTAMITQLDQRTESVGFANLPNIREIATRGPVTPDHVIRTKPIPVILEGDVTQAVNQYAENYHQYFLRNNAGDLKELDLAPR